MPKPSKEVLEALKDPALLKELGLQPATSEEEKELFSDIKLGENDNVEDLVRIMNDKSRKQRAYLKKLESDIVKKAESKAGEGAAAQRKAEVDSFLKTHPELGTNSDLLDIVEPLYLNGGKSLEEAWKVACASKGFDIKTGKAPEDPDKKGKDDKGEDQDKKDDDKSKGKTTSFKNDTSDDGLPGATRKDAEDDRPKTIREIAGELSNDMAAKGNNPFRDS